MVDLAVAAASRLAIQFLQSSCARSMCNTPAHAVRSISGGGLVSSRSGRSPVRGPGGQWSTVIRGRSVGILAAIVAPLLLAGCGSAGGSSTPPAPPCPSGQPVVVAMENFWGSIATQLGGDRVCVRSVIVSPDTDPHAYEAKPSDARLIAGARYVIANGAGYDPWVPKLIGANPVSGRVVLTVGD